MCCDFSNTPKRKYRSEADSGSGIESQQSEAHDSDEYYNNNSHKLIQQALGDQKLLSTLWINDKSDLDSLDSDYFKNSLHQLDVGDEPTKGKRSSDQIACVSRSCSKSEKRSLAEDTIITHHNNGYDETKQRNEHSDAERDYDDEDDDNVHENGNFADYCTIQSEEVRIIENYSNADDLAAPHSEYHDIDEDSRSKIRTRKSHKKIDDYETREAIDRKKKFKEDHRSVISYDSIYLSSEGSNETTGLIEGVDLEEKINEYLSDNNYSTLSEYTCAKKELSPNANTTNAVVNEHIVPEDDIQIDGEKIYDERSLYTQINKAKLKNNESFYETANGVKLTSFSDISSRGTLERLTFVSSPASTQREFANDTICANQFGSTLSCDNQYCSLPLANIGKSLQASEQIDAKLRQSCVAPLAEESKEYDTISNFGRKYKKQRQRENFDIILSSPVFSESEKLKEEAVLDIEPNTKEFLVPAAKKKETTKSSHSDRKKSTATPKAPSSSNFDAVEKKKSTVTSAATTTFGEKKAQLKYENNRVSKEIDIEIASFASAADLTDIDACSAKDYQVDEIRQAPTKIPLSGTTKAKLKLKTIASAAPREKISVESISLSDVKPSTGVVAKHRSYVKSNHSKRHFGSSVSGARDRYHGEHRLNGAFKNTLSNTLKRRIENKNRHNIGERPISKFVRNIDRANKANRVARQQAIIENIRNIVQPNFNMSRPQIMRVIDSSRCVSLAQRQRMNRDPEIENQSSEATAKAHREFRHKVNSMRNYWSKLADDDDDDDNDDVDYGHCNDVVPEKDTSTLSLASIKAKAQSPIVKKKSLDESTKATKTPSDMSQESREVEVRPVTRITSNSTLKRASSARSLKPNEREELNSFTPCVEIVELDQKQATIVKVQGTDSDDFDHVRYKVMKSDTFQKNILSPTRKEARMDGLLQYLHDFSFQVS